MFDRDPSSGFRRTVRCTSGIGRGPGRANDLSGLVGVSGLIDVSGLVDDRGTPDVHPPLALSGRGDAILEPDGLAAAYPV